MKMINTSPDTIRIPSELIHPEAWDDTSGARPARVAIPSGKVVRIDDRYAVRKIAEHAPIDPDTGARQAQPLPSVIEQCAPQLKPHGPEAEQLFRSTYHHELPQVQRVLAEQRKQAMDAEEAKRREKQELAEQIIASAAKPPAPAAQPMFLDEEPTLREE